MEKKKQTMQIGADFFEKQWEESWTYIKTVVDVVHEPILILDKNLCVMVANGPFYKTFKVTDKDTVGTVVYELGNKQWNIPSLRKLLEEILPHDTFFKGYEVAHDFPDIGRKIMLLNARQIHIENMNLLQPIILLAIEDITEMMDVAGKLADHVKEFENNLTHRTEKLETDIRNLHKELYSLKKK